jgi:hypothetical protein
MKRTIICTIFGVALLFVGLPLRASSTCSNPNSILNATYGWLAEGMVDAGNSKAPKIGGFIPVVQVGYITFDGNGTFSGAHDTSLGGYLTPHVDSGTYSVNSDCATGTISFATGLGFTVSIVITSGGQEIKFVSATTGGVTPGTLRLAAVAPCSTSALSGKSYGYAAHGLVGAGSDNSFPRVGGFVPFADAGRISFGADGTISGVDNANFGGVVMPGQPVAGTYIVNSNCTGTATMTIAGVNASWHFMVLQGAEQIIFVATPSGYVWAGTLTGIS